MFKSESKLKYVLIALVIIGLAYFLVLCFIPKYSITGQLLRQEHVIAKAEAENIQSFIENMGSALIDISKENGIIKTGSETTALLKSFVDKWGKNELIAGISLTDKDGTVVYNYSKISPIEIGTSLADRDYFDWAKNQVNSDKYIVGQSVIARYGVNKGKYITPLAVPVFKNGVFSGTVVSAIRTAELAKYYLGTMSVSKNTDIYLLGRDGYVLYSSSQPDKIGMHLSDSKQTLLFVDNNTLNQKIYNALYKEKDGSLVARYVDPISGKPETHALAYYPVKISGRHWLVILTTPAIEVTKPSTSTYIQQLSVIFFIALILFTAGVILLRKK